MEEGWKEARWGTNDCGEGELKAGSQGSGIRASEIGTRRTERYRTEARVTG